MSSGASGSDEKISGAKIQPLDSETKYNQTHDLSSRGVAGSDRNIDQSRIEPTEGNRGQYQHTAPHVDSHGVVGRDEVVSGAKIDPLVGEVNESTRKEPGLGDEEVDAGRIAPLGEVREEMR
ncbi:hypothetical protein BAUCODRAFT_128589 [Baudoinia panamericana UAMH 10762]|uniref:Uncharacterized protein n=1 Tax=Baudoinia panamericana (strain UAMH 10762) TaxID=717646 RepID=M2LYV4_BAUPA|nr:uncharacterized protein BAUCODRAFT_128589 [Baudoinia panamericana UAMH 10762]EMC99882.1 hypothetical protein BAUCODRAFT_128589 [Baudoinia panamericana UAMH 10762]